MRDGAVRDGDDRGIDVDGAPFADSAGPAGTGGPSDAQIAGERTVGDRQDVNIPKEGTTSGRGADDYFVVGQDVVGEAQDTAVVHDAATAKTRNQAVADGQAGDGHGRSAADVKDAAGVVAADGQLFGAGTIDGQVVRDVQLTAGEGDGALHFGGEVDRIRAGVGISIQDRLPQRAGAAVGEVQDREGAGQRSVLQNLQPGHET